MSDRKASPWARFKPPRDAAEPIPSVAHDDDGEHHWLCPSHLTTEGRELADRIGQAFKDEVERQAEEDALGSMGDLYSALWLDTGAADLDEAGKGERWLELMSMSLGYWLDCLVMDDVIAATDATPEQCHDVALLREMIRKSEGGGMTHGVSIHRAGREG